MSGLTIGLALALAVLLLLLAMSVRIVNEYERGVIFRLGRVIGAKGPGLFFIIPVVDRMVKVSLRTVTMDIPPQDVITRDNVTVRVNAVTYFNVVDPVRSVVAIENYLFGTSQIAQTTLRSILGQVDLDQLLINRDEINQRLQQIIDQLTDAWGDQGHPGGGQGRRAARDHAPGQGQPSRGRTRPPRQGHPRPRRARGGRRAG